MSKLLPNLPIENLTTKNDYIGIIEKGTLLKSFFLNNKDEFSEIKIFSIYGEWGSGKSTLMKYLERELKGSFNTFFFESWEFESDENLSLSLLETLTKNTGSITDGFIKNANKLLEGFAKSVTFKTPIVNINAEKIIEEVDKISFLELKEKFKSDFINWENKITEGDKSPDYNIVFIDDLDRCEPENILNLLSAMKLFFTYGKKTIFLCGIDKKAIREAVKTKYGEIVKANEYLEKVFDISFSMPESVDTSKLVHQYFGEDEMFGDEKLGDLISAFFDDLHFKNPRRIKKILNKYLIIKMMQSNVDFDDYLIPNIINNEKGTLFETYLTLYLLILKEFEPENFKLLFDLTYKRINYTTAIGKKVTENNEFKNAVNSNLIHLKEDRINRSLDEDDMRSVKGFNSIVAFFSPREIDQLDGYAFIGADEFSEKVGTSKKSYEYYFTIFILKNKTKIIKEFESISLSLLDYKKMISNLI
ncbi:KAP family P-loop NTPase fold protein [Polaribacter atrinae]|uniref:KAP NTPase domain-containing protein n=1 Tax=Polaribacter atrinae TaxID=1333662 RepID=A0A176TDU2_9FLAO|nr:P-loop NTPase fold protein [Polaribacter atrinae]OAD45565.1 hypothetical protein LPB303_07410 [Polaribacter atrinae]